AAQPRGTCRVNLLSEASKDAKKLTEIRAALAANRRACDSLGAARLTDAEIKARVSAELDDFCREAGGQLGELAFLDGPRLQPDVLADALRNPRALTALLRPQLEPALVARAIEEAGAADPVSQAERSKRLQALCNEREKLEHDEEREVLRLEALGYSV